MLQTPGFLGAHTVDKIKLLRIVILFVNRLLRGQRFGTYAIDKEFVVQRYTYLTTDSF